MRRIVRPIYEKITPWVFGKKEKEKHGPVIIFREMSLEKQDALRKIYEKKCLSLQHRYGKSTHS